MKDKIPTTVLALFAIPFFIIVAIIAYNINQSNNNKFTITLNDGGEFPTKFYSDEILSKDGDCVSFIEDGKPRTICGFITKLYESY